ncbi:hypothetical protein DBZ36_16530 [Alginatibacterium sediminis]|uniref:Acyltransferase 3 domain-containing protein n=1 Tax=Alginatibacterium sediminis TaxID=2164068 RepID=A0A420E6K9_9ALTE|nr:hypothetical protein DBZ36_16530 [Alginatibacterium sediminis]
MVLFILGDWLDSGVVSPPSAYNDFMLGCRLNFSLWFLLGVVFYQYQSLLSLLASFKTLVILLVCACLAFPAAYLSSVGVFGDLRTQPYAPLELIIHSLIKNLNTLSWVMLIMGITLSSFNHPSKLIRLLVEMSYPIYILHYIPIILVSAILIGQGFSQVLEVSLAPLITFFLCSVLYWVFIKFTPLNWIINGYHKSWFKLGGST